MRMHRLMRQLHLWIGAWGAIAAVLFGVTGFMQNHRGVMKLPQGDSTEVSKVELAVPESARASRDTLRAWLRDEQHINVENQRGPQGRGAESRGGGSRGADARGGDSRVEPQGGDSAAAESRRRESRGGGGLRGADARGGDPRGDASRGGESLGEPQGGDSSGSESRRHDSRGGGDDGQRAAQQNRWNFTGGNARVVTQVEYMEGAPSATVRTTVQSPLAVLERLHKGVGGGVAWILLGDSFALAMVALGISGLVLWSRGRSLRQMILSIVGVALLVLIVIGGSAIA